MKLNIRVLVRVDPSVDGLMDEWTENQIPLSHHAKSMHDNEFSLSVTLTSGSQHWLMLTSKETLVLYIPTIQVMI